MKKVIVIADVIMSLLAVGNIYADLRFFAIPKWIGLLSMVVLLALIVWEWIKEKRLWGNGNDFFQSGGWAYPCGRQLS